MALRWLVELFGDRTLVGAHPGVEFVDPATQRIHGEADVLLLFADGSLVPIEVKRNGAGVEENTERSMDTVSELLAAPWTPSW